MYVLFMIIYIIISIILNMFFQTKITYKLCLYYLNEGKEIQPTPFSPFFVCFLSTYFLPDMVFKDCTSMIL